MKRLIFLMLITTLLIADIGKVTVVKGAVTINRDLNFLNAKNDMRLLQEDIIQTEDGRLQMLFKDMTVVSLGKDTRFVIQEYLYEPENHQTKASFKLEKGFVKMITGAIGKAFPEYFTVETSQTKVTPHGTIWSMSVDEQNEVYQVTEGSISLKFNDGEDKEINLLAGERIRLSIQADKINQIIKGKIFRKIKNSQSENTIENNIAILKEEKERLQRRDKLINDDSYITTDGVSYDPKEDLESDSTEDTIGEVDDGNNGHGNDADGVDDSNPGKSKR